MPKVDKKIYLILINIGGIKKKKYGQYFNLITNNL